MTELERQQEDAAGVVQFHYCEMHALNTAIVEAKLAMRSEAGERALRRRRAEALRDVIGRIDCKFVVTGTTGGGPGKNNAQLVAVMIHLVAGDPIEY